MSEEYACSVCGSTAWVWFEPWWEWRRAECQCCGTAAVLCGGLCDRLESEEGK